MSSDAASEATQIENVIAELSRESEQDKAAARTEESYLSNVDSGLLISREREYRDVEKHWVRTKWLACAKEIVAANGGPITYLTLPAYHRIDVSLFAKHKLLKEEPDGQGTIAVAAFETDPTKFARMASQVPRLQLFGQEALEDVIVNPKNKYYTDLVRMFPFDLVNFDLTTSLTPEHEGPYSRVMQALEETLTRQAPHPNLWGLFLTFRNVKMEWEETALDIFLKNLQQNLDHHPRVREAFASKYNVPTVAALASVKVETAVTQSVVKWLADRAHNHNLEIVGIHSYHYVRYVPGLPSYVITKLIMKFRRGRVSQLVIPTKDTPRQSWMDDDLVKCISKNGHSDVEEILLTAPGRLVDELSAEVEELVNSVDESSRLAV